MAGCSVPTSLLLLSALTLWSTRSDPDPSTIEKGRTQLQMLQNFAQHPRYGDCWRRALQKVDVGCKELNEEEQSRIALAFTHCHLERSGRAFPICTEWSTVQECTHNMDTAAFNAYTEFFTHTHSICYYLQNELWQERTQDIILRLTVNSDSVAKQLEATNLMAEEMMHAQNATLKSQEQILRNGHLLKKTLQESTMGVRQAFEEMQQSASEQRLLFSEIFNRITYLHQFVVGESHTLYSFLYNLMSCGAVFLVTSTQRTAGARLVLFGLVAMNVYMERMICSFILGGSPPSYDQAESVTFWIGMSRKISVCLGLLVLLYVSVKYRDVQKESLEVLHGLHETKAELQSIIREAEKLLNKPQCSERVFLKEDLIFGDSGIPDPSFIQDIPVSDSMRESMCSEQLAQITSTPKRRSCSRSRTCSRRRSSRSTEPVVYHIPVTQPPIPRYNLRSGASINHSMTS
ncbi:uncharacterized protein LOC143809309 [Ranitomeya variabilis]|uniref:uncharacterized protein LOC143809309 n=1 Tax=Ranitomeya variabilis TaxID=490064 RepID=UPI0040571D9D